MMGTEKDAMILLLAQEVGPLFLREGNVAAGTISVLLHLDIVTISTRQDLGLRTIALWRTHTRCTGCNVALLVDEFEVIARE